jgi:hypothetical protein
MRQMSSIGWRRATCHGAVMAATVFLAVAPAAGMSAMFESGGIGFIPSSDVLLLPGTQTDGTDRLFTAADTVANPSLGSVDVQLGGSTKACALAAGSATCEPNLNGIDGRYSVIMALEIKVNAPELLGHEFTLILRGMDVTDGYDSMDVFIDLNPIVPSGFDTTQVSEFAKLWDDSFDPFVRIEDNFPADCADVGGICTYIGWTVKDGDVVTFRYEVDSFPEDTRPPPTLFYNAFNVVVPEPGTALLMGLGLVGLSFAGRRGGREHS